MMMKPQLLLLVLCIPIISIAQKQIDSLAIEKLRTQSGVDPTRVNSRIGYSMMAYAQTDKNMQLNNRLTGNLGINRWSFAFKQDIVTLKNSTTGNAFVTKFGDLRFTMLNAFYVKKKIAMAGSVEFGIPFAPSGFGTQSFLLTPAITFSYTIKPTIFLAIQPQYTFSIWKNNQYPNVSIITFRIFGATFLKSGYFFVLEPRPIINLGNKQFDLIISPIIGKALGAGFNLLFLAEIPTRKTAFDTPQGAMFQLGFNKNF